MIEQLEARTLFANFPYPTATAWDPGSDTPKGTLVFEYTKQFPGPGAALAGTTFQWSRDPQDPIWDGGPTPVLTLTNVPAHSEIKVLAHMSERDVIFPDADNGFVRLNNGAAVIAPFVEDVGGRTGAFMNTDLQPNGGSSTVTVEIGPDGTETGEWVRFTNVQVWIWTPILTIQHPPSLNEGDNANVVITRTGGDHGIFPIPVSLAKVDLSQTTVPNPATSDEWTLATSVTIPPVQAGSTTASVNAALSIVDDTAYEPQETAAYRVLPSSIHTQGGTVQQPSGNRTFNINLSDFNPYGGGGGYQPQGAFSDDPIVSGDDGNYAGELVDAVAGDLVGEVVL